MGVVGSIASYCVAAEEPAPWGNKMPPDKISFNLVSDRGRSKCYFGEYSAQLLHSNEPQPNRKPRATLLIFGDRPMPQKQPIATWNFGGKFEDGECVPFGGQVYRWTINEKLGRGTFLRIPDHPLAVPPEKSESVVSVQWHNGLSISSRHSGLIPVTERQVSATFKIDHEKVRAPGAILTDKPVGVPLSVTYFNGTDSEKPVFEEATEGKVLNIGPWAFKVERIVLPDPDQHIPGWVDLRVQKADPPKPQN